MKKNRGTQKEKRQNGKAGVASFGVNKVYLAEI